MSARDEIIQGITEAFDALRSEFFPDATLELLKVSAGSNTFEVVEEIDSGWFLKYSEYRQNFKLEIATTDESFRDTIAKVSDVRINGDVYNVAQGDRVPPNGASLTWTLYCTRQQGARPNIAAR
jgi:hypothetical protein